MLSVLTAKTHLQGRMAVSLCTTLGLYVPIFLCMTRCSFMAAIHCTACSEAMACLYEFGMMTELPTR